MKRRLLLIGLLVMLAALCLNGVVIASAEPTVSLTVNGKTGTVATLTNQNNTVLVRAPGATAVRIWNPSGDFWDYYDRYQPLECLEQKWCFNTGTVTVSAQARYDDYEDDRDLGCEEDEAKWTAVSNQVTLNMTAPHGVMAAPNARLAKATVSQAEWLNVSVTPASDDAWYWTDAVKVVGDEIEWMDGYHFDFTSANTIAIPATLFEPGSYQLLVHGKRAGYEQNETALNFTVTSGQVKTPGLYASDATLAVGEDAQLYMDAGEHAHMMLEITQQGNPTWYDRREWDCWWNLERWCAGDPGVYDFKLTAWINGVETPLGEATVTFTDAGANGRLSRPDYSAFPSVLTDGQGISAAIGVDARTKWLDLDVQYCPEDGDRQTLYHSNRTASEDENWTLVDLPADLFAQDGWYRIGANAHTNGLANNWSEYSVLKTSAALGGGIELKINGSKNDIDNYDSSADIRADATAANATAIRIRQNGWWDTRDAKDGKADWNFGFGTGDYVVVAQMTTAEPVWRADDFDWGSFRWEDLEWTNLSNAVRVHVTSPNGALAAPEVTVTPANATVTRGEYLEVSVEPQGFNEWTWAEIRKLRYDENGWPQWDDFNMHVDGNDDLTLRLATYGLEPGDYYLDIGVDARGVESNSTLVPFHVDPAQNLPDMVLEFSRDDYMPKDGFMTITAYAQGANYMMLDIDQADNPNWHDWRDTGRECDWWTWSCASGGDYTFKLTAFYPDGSSREMTREYTVNTLGRVADPQIENVPGLMKLGTALNGNIRPVEGAYYKVWLSYEPDEGGSEELYFQERAADDTALAFDGGVFAREGWYKLSVESIIAKYDSGYNEVWFYVLDAEELPDMLLKLSRDSMPANDGGVDATAIAPGANHLRVEVAREGDEGWLETRDSDRESDRWGFGFGNGGNYTFTLIASYPDGSTKTAAKPFTVTSDGKLDDPVVSGVPTLMKIGDGINGSFQPIRGTENYSVDLNYCPDYGWENLYHADLDPQKDANYTALNFGGDLFNREGRYCLEVSAMTRGVDVGYTQFWFTVLDVEEIPDVLLKLDSYSYRVHERGTEILAVAPGASHMDVDITWDRDEDWNDHRETDGESETWGWGCGCGGVYTFTLTATFPNGSVKTDVKTLTVTSDGALDAPQLQGVPTLLKLGDAIDGSFRAIDGAENYNVSLEYCPENEAWINLYDNTRDPADANATLFHLDGGLFNREGRYKLSVSAWTVGKDHGYREAWITVLDVEVLPDILLELDRDSFLVNDGGVTITAAAPGASNLDVDITWDRNPEWRDHRDSNRESDSWGWGCGCGGVYTFTLTATYPDGTTKTASKQLTVTTNGALDEPQVDGVPTLLKLGDPIDCAFQAIANAQSYTIRLEYCPDDGDWDEVIRLDRDPAEANATQIHLDGGLFNREGRYKLSVEAEKVGWDIGYSEYWITVLDVEELPDVLLTLSPETFLVYDGGTEILAVAPGASHLDVEITWDREPNWHDHRDADGDYASWGWGCGNGGVYTFTLTATFPDGSTKTASKLLTVTSNGALENPQVAGVPTLMKVGDAIDGSFQAIDGAENYSIWLEYVPNEGDWENLYDVDRNATDANATQFHLDGGLFNREGQYKLSVSAWTRGKDQGYSESWITVLNVQELPDVLLTFNRDSMQANEGMDITAVAPGATYMRVDITKNDDPYWIDMRDTGRDYETWGWGCGTGGEYTFTLTATFPDGSTKTAVKPFTVHSEGSLDRPVFTNVPAILKLGTGIDGSFQAIAGAQGYSVWLNYIPDEGDWEDLYNQNRDPAAAGATALKLDGSLFNREGWYKLAVNAWTVGVDSGYTEQWIRVLNAQELPDLLLEFDRETMQSNEGMDIRVMAPGASHMHVDITWNRDRWWHDQFDSNESYDTWGWGCGCGGKYTFTLTATYPDGSEKKLTKTINVFSEGKLDAPILTGVPKMMKVGDAINGSFQAIAGAAEYHVDLSYVSDDDADWETLIWEERDPADAGATALAFDGSLFNRPGRYFISVNAYAQGVDNGYTDAWILVMPAEAPSENLVLKVNGKTNGDDVSVLLYQGVNLTLEKPDTITAARVWTGWGWDYWAGRNENYRGYLEMNNPGEWSIVAQATTDASVREWGEAHDDNFDGFNWDQVNWSLTSNTVVVNVTKRGTLDAPAVHMPANTRLTRGEWLEFSFDPVENASVYGVCAQRIPEDAEWIDPAFDEEYNEAGTVRIPTASLEAGKYRLIIDPRRYGYDCREAVSEFEVVDPATPIEDAVFAISKAQVRTNERFEVSLYAPGAEEVRFCHETFENDWECRNGDRLTIARSCDRPMDYVFYAYARYADGNWTQIGDAITVTATAPKGSLAGEITAPRKVNADEAIELSFVWHSEGVWAQDFWINLIDANGNEVLDRLEAQGKMDIQNYSEGNDDFIVLTIPAGVLETGAYRFEAHVRPGEVGYDWTEKSKTFYVVDSDEPILTSIKGTYLAQELTEYSIFAPGATKLSMWVSEQSPVPQNDDNRWYAVDGDTIETADVFGSRAGKCYVKIVAEYEGGATETKDLEINITAPNGDLGSPRICMSGVWTEGQNLKFSVEQPEAVFVATTVKDKATGEVIYADEMGRFDDRNYDIPAAGFAPGRWYTLEVYATGYGYNDRSTAFDVIAVPANPDTLTLPAGLAVIEADAFGKVAAQKIVFSGNATTVNDGAFADCPNLVQVELPADVSGISLNAFDAPFMVYGRAGSQAEAYAFRSNYATFIYLK